MMPGPSGYQNRVLVPRVLWAVHVNLKVRDGLFSRKIPPVRIEFCSLSLRVLLSCPDLLCFFL